MAISASSGNFDAIVRSGPGKSVFEDGRAATSSSSACTWNQGDLICYDTSTHLIRPVASTGDGATFIGVADNAVTNGQLNSPYQGLTPVNAAQSGPGYAGPKFAVIASMKLHTADAFNIGTKVYVSDGDDCQTVTVTDPGNAAVIGIFQGPSAVASAASGQRVFILLNTRYPAVGL